MRRRAGCLAILSLAVLVCTVPFLLLMWDRVRLDFDAEGRFFDESSGVVYKDSSVVGYSLIGAFGVSVFALLLGSSIWSLRDDGRGDFRCSEKRIQQ